MHQLLTLGATLPTAAGQSCTIKGFLGGGGQGEVYRVEVDGQALALKWYFPEQATADQRQALVSLIRKPADAPCACPCACAWRSKPAAAPDAMR